MVLPGFNTDFKYRGETYHVQTEDNGVNNPVVVTLLYFKGAILASRRTPYGELIGTPTFQKDLMVLMKSQHKDLMRECVAGIYDRKPSGGAVTAKAPAAAPPPPAPPPREKKPLTLDEAITRYLESCAAGAGKAAAAL